MNLRRIRSGKAWTIVKRKSAGFDKLAAEVRTRDDYWIERAKLGFSIGLGDLLEASGLTKADIARKLGTSPAYITKVFRGDVNFTIESMVRFVRALGGRLDLQVAPATAPGTKGNQTDHKSR